MQKEKTIRPDDPDTAPTQKLLVSGLIQLALETDPVSVQRGTPMLAENGLVVGAVAALVLNCRQEITHLLLGQVPPTAVYRLIPLSLINRIDDGVVWLKALSADIDKLPTHQPDD